MTKPLIGEMLEGTTTVQRLTPAAEIAIRRAMEFYADHCRMWASRGDILAYLATQWQDKHDEAQLLLELLRKCEHVLITHKGAPK